MWQHDLYVTGDTELRFWLRLLMKLLRFEGDLDLFEGAFELNLDAEWLVEVSYLVGVFLEYASHL